MLKNTDNVVKAIRYAVRTRGYWVTFVKENNITRDMIADTARELAALAYPNDEPVQKKDGKRTRFGNAVQAAGNGLRAAIDKDDADDKTPDYLDMVRQAVKKARDKGECPHEAILRSVEEALSAAK